MGPTAVIPMDIISNLDFLEGEGPSQQNHTKTFYIQAPYVKELGKSQFCNPSRMVSFFAVVGGLLGPKYSHYHSDTLPGMLLKLTLKRL